MTQDAPHRTRCSNVMCDYCNEKTRTAPASPQDVGSMIDQHEDSALTDPNPEARFDGELRYFLKQEKHAIDEMIRRGWRLPGDENFNKRVNNAAAWLTSAEMDWDSLKLKNAYELGIKDMVELLTTELVCSAAETPSVTGGGDLSRMKDNRGVDDHNRLVRELDVLINGEEGAAKQASLCDIVSQVRNIKNYDAEALKEKSLKFAYRLVNQINRVDDVETGIDAAFEVLENRGLLRTTPEDTKGDELKTAIAIRGMFFMEGLPPITRDPIIVWTGGCNCLVIYYREETKQWCYHSGTYRTPFKDFDDIYCWMRLPHPSFWPDVAKPELMDEDTLYHSGTKWFATQQPEHEGE